MTREIFDLWWLQLIPASSRSSSPSGWPVPSSDSAILLVVYVGIVALSRGITEIFLAFKLKDLRKRLIPA